MWNKIKNENDIIDFMNYVHNFHDSCVKEIKYCSGAYVDADLSMQAINHVRSLNIIIQSQYEDIKTIELMFNGLKNLILSPVDENYTCEILNSVLKIKDNYIYWADDDIENLDLFNDQGIFVCAESLKWRLIDDAVSKKL